MVARISLQHTENIRLWKISLVFGVFNDLSSMYVFRLGMNHKRVFSMFVQGCFHRSQRVIKVLHTFNERSTVANIHSRGNETTKGKLLYSLMLRTSLYPLYLYIHFLKVVLHCRNIRSHHDDKYQGISTFLERSIYSRDL